MYGSQQESHRMDVSFQGDDCVNGRGKETSANQNVMAGREAGAVGIEASACDAGIPHGHRLESRLLHLQSTPC